MKRPVTTPHVSGVVRAIRAAVRRADPGHPHGGNERASTRVFGQRRTGSCGVRAGAASDGLSRAAAWESWRPRSTA